MKILDELCFLEQRKLHQRHAVGTEDSCRRSSARIKLHSLFEVFFLIPIKPVVGASRGHSGRGRMVAPLLCTEWTTSSWGCGALPSFFVDRGAVAAAERTKHKGFARGIKMY